jgi:hypothetical protein
MIVAVFPLSVNVRMQSCSICPYRVVV